MPAAQAHPQEVSDLPPKADICGAVVHVSFGPKATATGRGPLKSPGLTRYQKCHVAFCHPV